MRSFLPWLVVLAVACGDDDDPGDAAAPDAAVADAGADPDGGSPDDDAGVDAGAPDAGGPTPRLIVASREGQLVSLDLASPWAVRASGDTGAVVASVRCSEDFCLVVHPSPVDAISFVFVEADELSVARLDLESGSDPRDVAFAGPHSVVISQYGRDSLIILDPDKMAMAPFDLSRLADEDGLPEADRMAVCGRQVYVQLRRVDHETGAPATAGAAIAVIDLDLSGTFRLVDAEPATPGPQGVALARRPAFDMPVDCEDGTLYVVEPAPLMMGGSRIQQIDLETLVASDLPLDVTAEAGGLEVVGDGLYWLITHTEFGPGPSSHLTLEGGPVFETHNTFALEHVNDLALDHEEGLLFYPDPCGTLPATGCRSGIHVFAASTGERLSPTAGIDVGFDPIEVAIAR